MDDGEKRGGAGPLRVLKVPFSARIERDDDDDDVTLDLAF